MLETETSSQRFGLIKPPQALLISPKNSIEGQLSLIEKSEAIALLFTPEMNDQVVEPIVASSNIRTHTVPELEALIDGAPVDSITPAFYGEPLEELCARPMLVLHTSGSTGIPKPIIQRYGYL